MQMQSKHKDNQIFNSIRKATAPPTRLFKSKDKDVVGRKAKHKKKDIGD